MSKPWRRSKSLVKLMSQINAAYPSRDTTSDGAIGDAAHATRNSDHNPWVIDRSGQPVVTGQDIDEDLDSKTHSIQKVVDAICASRDKRVKYIIYEGKITVKGSQLQKWQHYDGKNSHSHHCHISVFPDQDLYDDQSPWAIGVVGGGAASADGGVHASAAVEPVLEIPATKPAEQAANVPAEKPVEIPQPAATQNAEQITNITGDKTVPDNFVPEDKELDAPSKEGSTAKAATVTVLGIAVPTFLAGAVTAIKNAIADGTVDAREVGRVIIDFLSQNTKFVFIGVFLLVAGMMLKKLYKQVTLWLSMYIAARSDMHNVTVKPQ